MIFMNLKIKGEFNKHNYGYIMNKQLYKLYGYTIILWA